MTFSLLVATISVVVLLGMLALLELGRARGRRLRALQGDRAAEDEGYTAVDGAVFGLLGLLIAFTFGGAASRFEARRQLAIEEGNRFGTAWLRLDLLPEPAQPELRALFRSFLDARIDADLSEPGSRDARASLERAQHLQARLWTQAVQACSETPTNVASLLLLPALNELMDLESTREFGANIHPPGVVFAMLAALALLGALLAGHAMSSSPSRPWLHTVGFALAVASTVYVILEMEYPRIGWIRADRSEPILLELRHSMDSSSQPWKR